MTQFDFTLNTPEAIRSDIKRQSSFFAELETWGHLAFALDLYRLMEEQKITSFKVARASHDYEGGYDVYLEDFKFDIPQKEEEDWLGGRNWEISDLLRQTTYALEGSVVISLNPEQYDKKVFTRNIDDIMDKICSTQIYELWLVLKSKSLLDQNLSLSQTLPKKPDFKI